MQCDTLLLFFFFSSRRRHTRVKCDWSSDVCSSDLLAAVELTLEKMAQGGIYDHLGGGIHRYSTDPEWLVPHFEKMLYDQALVSSIYLEGFQITGREDFAE